MLFIMAKISIIIFAILMKSSLATLIGVCNECLSSNNVTCLDETHFSACLNGLPVAMITSCPGNHVCTDDLLICRSLDEGFAPICYQDYCGDCAVTNGVYACLNETTYGYCFAGDTPNEGAIRSCPAGYVCSINSANICVPEESNQPSCLSEATTTTTTLPTESTTDDITTNTTDTTTEIIPTTDTTTESSSSDTTTPTFSTTTEIIPTTDTTTEDSESSSSDTTLHTSSTTAAPRLPNAICKEIAKKGYFKSDDPTCREYIYCYPLSGQYLGWFYYCVGYFNVQTQNCQTERPIDCIEY